MVIVQYLTRYLLTVTAVQTVVGDDDDGSCMDVRIYVYI